MDAPKAGILLGIPKAKASEPAEESGDSDHEDMAQDMIDAVKDGDAKALALVIGRICSSYEDDSDEE
jgi:hypothetical protein